MAKSRLEINFIRLLEETQLIANGSVTKDWKFEKETQNLLVLYGSQTGTAQEKAHSIGRKCLQYFFLAKVKALNDITLEELQLAPLAIFVVATTGQGDDPENMRDFFKNLWSERKNKELLKNLNYGVIGLGDSSYMKFNYSAKRLNKLLSVVGGNCVLDLALADDQHELGPDYVIEKWLKEFWLLLKQKLPPGIEPLSKPILLEPKYKVITDYESYKSSNKINESFYDAPITLNVKKTSDKHFQDVRLIEFEIPVSSHKFHYSPGDVLQIQPQNTDEDVETFLSIIEEDGNEAFILEAYDRDIPLPDLHILPQPCTIRQCVKSYFDIRSIPTRGFFELLSFFANNDLEEEKFVELSLPEGQQDYYNYCTRPKRSILEVLADFPFTNKNIPFEYLFDLIPSIKPRDYSIASSSLACPGKVQILMAVVEYKTILKKPRKGLCSNWLINQPLSSKVWIAIKKGTLTFPNDSTLPVIMIGPGTGCAPFQSYIQERQAKGDCSNVVMIFGCRNQHHDFFFKEEWQNNKELSLMCAFSRDQKEKIYVQHVMRNNYKTLWSLIKNGAYIYYAGNAKRIPIDVYEALEFVCQKGADMSDKDLQNYMTKSLQKRYQTESWA